MSFICDGRGVVGNGYKQNDRVGENFPGASIPGFDGDDGCGDEGKVDNTKHECGAGSTSLISDDKEEEEEEEDGNFDKSSIGENTSDCGVREFNYNYNYQRGDGKQDNAKIASGGCDMILISDDKEYDDDDDDDGDDYCNTACVGENIDVGVRGCDEDGDEKEDDNVVVEVQDDAVIPVDKGRAWLVMMSCFLMHVLVVGGGKSFGVFVQEFQDRFQVGAKELGVINAMPLMLMFSLGIFVNMLAVRFSARRVVTAGSLLTSVGFILTAFVTNFRWLYVTYGVVTGLGFALSFSPTIVMVGQCFKKYRSVALGIALSGAGLGSFMFPGLARFLINHYGLRGCLLIIGGLMLNVTLCGFLLPPHRNKKSKNRKISNANDVLLLMEKEKCFDSDEENKDFEETLSRNNDCGGKVNEIVSCKTLQAYSNNKESGNGEFLRKYHSLSQEHTITVPFISRNGNAVLNVKEDPVLEIQTCSDLFSDKLSLQNRRDVSEIMMNVKNGCISTTRVKSPELNAKLHNGDVTRQDLFPVEIGLLSKSANFLHFPNTNTGQILSTGINSHQNHKEPKSLSTSHLPGSLKSKDEDQNIKNSFTKISTSLAHASNCDLAMHSQGNNIDFDRLPIMTSGRKELRSRNSNKMAKSSESPPLFEWSLLRNIPFIMHLFSVYFGFMCYITNLFMLANYANSCGLDRDTAALTLSVVGILELVARLTFPPITEIVPCRRRTCWGGALTIMGLLNLAVPHITVLSSIMAYAVVFGYACGCFTALVPVLCAEISGPEKMGSSFGVTTIGMGLAVMTGPPLSGTIKDISGRWDHGFVTVGCLALISASLAFLEPFVQTRWKARHQKHNEAIAT